MYKEGDVVKLRNGIKGNALDDNREIFLQAGTTVTVVLIHGNPNVPDAYEVEAYLEDIDCYVLATVESGFI